MKTKQPQRAAKTPADLREEAGLTVAQVTSGIDGVSESTLMRLEAGRAGITTRTIYRLARLYGCTPGDLFDAYLAKGSGD